MKLCTRCGIDTNSTTGMCFDCREVERSNAYRISPLDREERDFEIWNDWKARKSALHTAHRLGVSDRTVWRSWRRMGLEPLMQIDSTDISKKIRELHARGLTHSEIGARVFLSPNRVSERLVAMGMRTRGLRKDSQKGAA